MYDDYDDDDDVVAVAVALAELAADCDRSEF